MKKSCPIICVATKCKHVRQTILFKTRILSRKRRDRKEIALVSGVLTQVVVTSPHAGINLILYKKCPREKHFIVFC